MSDQYTSPKIWGPHFWFILRCIANNYSDNPTKEETAHVRTFFTELQFVLPCEVCKYTFRQHYNRNPLDKYLSNRDKLMEWVEIIYQETKKVIQDKRIKIIDSFEEAPEIAVPMRTVYKSKHFDPLSIRLDEIRKKAAEQKKLENKINNNVPVTTTTIQDEAKKIADSSKPVTQIVKLEHPKPVIQIPIQPSQPQIINKQYEYTNQDVYLDPINAPNKTVDPMLKLVQPKPLIQIQEVDPMLQFVQQRQIAQIPKPIIQIPKPIIQAPKHESVIQKKEIKKEKTIDISSSPDSSKAYHSSHKNTTHNTKEHDRVPYTLPGKLVNVNIKPVNIDIPKNTILKKDKKRDISIQSLQTIKKEKDKISVTKPQARQSIPKTYVASKIHNPPLIVTKRCKKCDDKAAK